MPLVRVASGLLARHEAGSSTHPFSAADWDVPSGVTVSVDAQGRLALSLSPVPVWRHIHHRHVPSRTRVFTQSLAARTSGIWGGDAAHADAGGTNHVRIQWSYGRPAGEATFLAQNTGDTETGITPLTPVPARASGVDYRFSLWVDGAEVVGHDHGNALTISGTSTTHTSGGVGCALGGGGVGRRYSAYYVMADRYLRVYNLPPAYRVRVGGAVGVADSDGLATVDLLTVPFPQAVIEVLDAAGVVVSTYTPDDGVWGGDEYLWEGDYVAGVLRDAPSGYWRLGEQSGAAVMADASGNVRHGTYAGATLGHPGALVNDLDTAAGFSGSTSAAVPSASWMDVGTLSVEAWLRRTGKTGVITYIVNRSADQANVNSWILWKNTSDQLVFQVTVGGVAHNAVASVTFPLDVWVHAVGTYDGETVRLYLNGELAAENSTPSGQASSSNSAIRLARPGAAAPPQTATQWYEGLIDEVAFYDHVLSPARIKAHYLLGVTPKSAVPPHQPTISVVVRGQGKVTLLSSPFSSDDPDAEHAASRWLVTTDDDADFEAPIYDSGWIEDLTEHTVAGLPAGPQFLAVVAHRDRRGNESPWSEPAAFRASTWEPCPPPPATEWEGVPRPGSVIEGDYAPLMRSLNPALYWRLHDIGPTAEDSSEHGRHGTAIDTTFRAPGLFPGSAYAARIAAGGEIRRDHEAWMQAGGYGIVLWVQADDYDTPFVLASMGELSGSTVVSGSWVLLIANRQLRIYHRMFNANTGVFSSPSVATGPILVPGQAHMVAAWCDIGSRWCRADTVKSGTSIGPGGYAHVPNANQPFRVRAGARAVTVSEVAVFTGVGHAVFESWLDALWAARLTEERLGWEPAFVRPSTSWERC